MAKFKETLVNLVTDGIKYAAKTGTTNFDEKTIQAHNIPANKVNDLWAIGFNTEYAIGVWYGYKDLNSGYYNNLNALQQARLFQAVGKKIFTNGIFCGWIIISSYFVYT